MSNARITDRNHRRGEAVHPVVELLLVIVVFTTLVGWLQRGDDTSPNKSGSQSRIQRTIGSV